MCVLYVAAEQRAMIYYATVSVGLKPGRLSGSLNQSLRKLQCQAAFSSGHLSGEESASKLIIVECCCFFFLSYRTEDPLLAVIWRPLSALRGCFQPRVLPAILRPPQVLAMRPSLNTPAYFTKAARRVSRVSLLVRWYLLSCYIITEWHP